MPSNDALRYHFLRTCYVSEIWGKASQNIISYPPIIDWGWHIGADLSVNVKWDSESNLSKVDQRIKLWTKGCGCKVSMCKYNSCSCKKEGKSCGPGCVCKAQCLNHPEDPSIKAMLIALNPENENEDVVYVVQNDRDDLSDAEQSEVEEH